MEEWSGFWSRRRTFALKALASASSERAGKNHVFAATE
jgi:hypothetical protein